MKKTNVLLIAITMFAIGFGLNNVAMSNINGKIAVVDVQTVVSNSAQVKTLKKNQEKNIQELDKWIKTARTDIEKQKTEAGKEKLAKKYDAELLKKREKISKEYNEKLKEIDSSISATIAEQAKAGGYDIVLSKGVVLFGGEDITKAISKAVK